MSKMFTSGFKPQSTTLKAKKIIRNEMLSYFNPKDYKDVKTRLDAMKKDADAGNGGAYGKRHVSDYEKGAYLVDAACLSIYDQDKMLSKIYGKDKVKTWSPSKQHEIYKHLVGREYSAMLRERNKKR